MTTRMTAAVAAGVALLLVGGFAGVAWLAEQHDRRGGAGSADEEFRPTRLDVPRQPVTSVPVKPVRDVPDLFSPEDLVLGATVNGESRAYPIAMLNHDFARKVVNDTLGGSPIAVTWCDACQSGAVYARATAGGTLTLAVFGELWKNSAVLYDTETMTRWSQLSGEAQLGPLKGQALRPLPSLLTDWKAWRAKYPDSTVAAFESKGPSIRHPYADRPERFVLGIASGTGAKAWDLDRLVKERVVNDEWAGRPVVTVWDEESGTARLFARGSVARFEWQEGRLLDADGGTTWDPVTGEALPGPRRGEPLEPLPATLASRTAWEKFYPRESR